MPTMLSSNFTHALAIFGLTFVFEDVAVLGAALLVVNSMVSLGWAAGSSFAGIWLGDLGLYFLALRLGRPVLDKPWFRRLMGKVDLRQSECWFQHHGTAAILLSRAIPGTRLPTYLAAGLLRVPAPRFIIFTAAACLLWVGGLFWLSWHVGMMAISAFRMFKSEAAKVAICVVLALSIAWPLRKMFRKISIRRWEFWPPALFYIPVAFKYIQLSMKYGSVSLPTIANPGMTTGGIVGESKYSTLRELAASDPSCVARTHLIRFESSEQAWQTFERLRCIRDLQYPLVLKPDVGQRGFGFKLVHSDMEARSYLNEFRRDTLVQEYAPGPLEAGILYYRHPGETRGRIFAITDKLFPSVAGDNVHNIEELIRADRRASAMAEVYLRRFGENARRIPPIGEIVKLVEAGNHCQGSIFLDGQHLWSRELEDRIDALSRSINGFYFGRYDLRYRDADELRRGEGFQIIELNGASSDATSIYDPKNYPTSIGGAVIDSYGSVFGLVSGGLSRSSVLVITHRTVDRVAEALSVKGRIARGYLGIGLQTVAIPQALRNQFGIQQDTGIMALSVEEHGPAAAAGLMMGDVIVSLNGAPVTSPESLHGALDPSSVGKQIGIVILRGAARHQLTVTVGERPVKTGE